MSRLQRKRGRPSNYRKSLKHNEYWNKVRRKVLIRDNFQCVLCESPRNLEIHHCAYKINGVSIMGKELEHLKWMICLCEDCHQDQHMVPNEVFNPKNPKRLNVNEFLDSQVV